MAKHSNAKHKITKHKKLVQILLYLNIVLTSISSLCVNASDEEARQYIINKATYWYNSVWSPAVKCYGWEDQCTSVYDASEDIIRHTSTEEDATWYNSTHTSQHAVAVNDCLVIYNCYTPNNLYHIPYGMVSAYSQAAGSSGKYIKNNNITLFDGEDFVSVKQFINSTTDVASGCYAENVSNSLNKEQIKIAYMADCADFVSDCWNVPRMTVGYFMDYYDGEFTDMVGMFKGFGTSWYRDNVEVVKSMKFKLSADTVSRLQPGDALANSGHIVLVYDIYKSEDSGATFIQIMQESGAEAQLNKKTFVSIDAFLTAYSDYYVLKPTPEILGNIPVWTDTSGVHSVKTPGSSGSGDQNDITK